MRHGRALLTAAILTATAGFPSIARASDWVEYDDESASRLSAAPGLGLDDPEEKSYAWGDVDNDGDQDLVVARKAPFDVPGPRPNVLFLNEDGVLVDRTLERASASDVPGDQGFLTPTNDRDVTLADVNGDGYLDVITATTISDGEPKVIGHPRVYVNLGADAGGWLGLRYEAARIPQLVTDDGLPVNPRFNAVSAGDVTGDGAVDLYFVDSDEGFEPAEFDLDDRLLINDGRGFFTDQSKGLMTSEMLRSSYGAGGEIVDMNGDGRNDVIKSSTGLAPVRVTIAYNDLTGSGVFDVLDTIYQNSSTYLTTGDLDNDGRADVVVTDDGLDRYLINLGNDDDGLATFSTHGLDGSGGFGGNTRIADLDADGFDDVVVTDVDFVIPGCTRSLLIYRNEGDTPPVTLTGDVPNTLPTEDRRGTHDAAVFDVNGDGFADLVTGRCSGTQVWIAAPAGALSFDVVALPEYVPAGVPVTFEVFIQGIGVTLEPGTGRLHAAINDGPFETTVLQELMGSLHRAELPAASCGDVIRFYLSAETTEGGSFFAPAAAPLETFLTRAIDDVEQTFADDIEGDDGGWSVESEDLVSGAWEAVEPIGTMVGGSLAAPNEDATPGTGVRAFVTENGRPGGAATVSDVDGGPTYLIAPPFDVPAGDAKVSYRRWFFCDDEGLDGADVFTVDVSGDGGTTWLNVPSQTTTGTGSAWQPASFFVSEAVLAPDGPVLIRFGTADLPNDSVTEAGVDDLEIEAVVCHDTCAANLDGSGDVGFGDLLSVLSAWGPCGGCPQDLDASGAVGFGDLLVVLAAWGACG